MAKFCWFCQKEVKAIEYNEEMRFSIPYYQMYKCEECGRIFQALDEPIKVK